MLFKSDGDHGGCTKHQGSGPRRMYVFRTADGDDLDLLALLTHLYGQLPPDAPSIAQRLAEALRRLSSAFPLVVTQIAADRVAYRWNTEATEQIWRVPRGGAAAEDVKRDRLILLERIGHDVLSNDVHFRAADARLPRRTRRDYARWSTGETGLDELPIEIATAAQRAATVPSLITPLWPLLDCYRRLVGPVGLYWLVPMLFAMAPTALTGTVAVVDVPCVPEALATLGHSVRLRPLCADLPAACRIRYHWWPRTAWRAQRSLVAFVMFYQCHVLAGDLGSWQRQHGRRGDNYFPLDPSADDLLLVTVAGIPLAVAGVQPSLSDGSWYLSALCAATRSTGGSLAMEHLKGRGRVLLADVTADAEPFYVRHGFVCDDARGQMIWVPRNG